MNRGARSHPLIPPSPTMTITHDERERESVHGRKCENNNNNNNEMLQKKYFLHLIRGTATHIDNVACVLNLARSHCIICFYIRGVVSSSCASRRPVRIIRIIYYYTINAMTTTLLIIIIIITYARKRKRRFRGVCMPYPYYNNIIY